MRTDVIVIGGGASGLIAALSAAAQGASVLLLDKNVKLGRKLRITGKGRCNLTNDCDVNEVLRHIPGDGRFLYSALTAFSPQDTIAFFEQNGLPLKTERGKRVFPQSDRADDVADLLIRMCKNAGVSFRQGCATELSCQDGAIKGVFIGDQLIECKCCIVCTGGLSYPLTGSTGDGYRFAESAGHHIEALRPSLVPLESPDPCCQRLQGLSLKNVALRIYEDERLLCCDQGEMLFTHFGVSGPLVLSASARMLHWDRCIYRMEIDLKPALDEKKLDDRLLRDFTKNRNRDFRHALEELAPQSLIPELIRLSGIPADLKANSVTKEMRRSLLQAFKAFPIPLSGTRPWAEAIITAGGVCTKEVSPRSMESKLVSGLFFAGEVLDLDAYTGGYNLQIAWSTGRLAGLSAGKKSRKAEHE